MLSSYFSVEGITPISSLPPRAKIHVIGVAGVAMAQIAIALSERSFTVSGSDKEFYDPMGSLLKKSKVKLYTGYSEENFAADLDLVIIGNAVSADHPEVVEVERRRLPYSIFPQALFELAISQRRSIIVSGTHGKTTTTAMLATVLEKLGRSPSYFIGGKSVDLKESLAITSGTEAVIEGDEYDSSFFAKVPKFFFYKPNIWIITSLEYDHADIYPDLASIDKVFFEQIKRLSPDDVVISNVDGEHIREQLELWREHASCKFVSYGEHQSADFRVSDLIDDGTYCKGTLFCKGIPTALSDSASNEQFEIKLNILGRHNILNGIAVFLAAKELGIPTQEILSALLAFHGVERRQQIRYCQDGITVIDDFAHHPTAVLETLSAVRARYPAARLWAVFEPRSNTSRRKVFETMYIDAFQHADQVVLCQPTAKAIDQSSDLIDVSTLASKIAATYPSIKLSIALPDANSIAAYLMENLKRGDVVLVMSNGSFGGLVGALVMGLTKRI